MNSNKKFNTRDYFKGFNNNDYSFDELEKISKEAALYPLTSGSSMVSNSNDKLHYPLFEDLDIYYAKTPSTEIEPIPFTIPECIHEPIDVGFVGVKLVCKKCDKDL